MTRQKYLALAYPDGLPEEWTAETEMQLPEALRPEKAGVGRPDRAEILPALSSMVDAGTNSGTN